MSITKHIDLETLADVVTAIPSNIFFKDKDLNYVFCSHIWEQVDISNNPDFDIYGKSDRDIRKDTENLDNVEKTDRAILETGIGTSYTIKSEVDGHCQFLELKKEPVRDKNGNIIGIVGLINDVTGVTEELSEMLDNEKAYQNAMREGARLAYNVNLTKDILKDDLIEVIDGKEVNILELLGLKAPCSYKEMMMNYTAAVLDESCRNEFSAFHDSNRLIELFKSGHREVTKEFRLLVNGLDGSKTECWVYVTVLLMQNNKNDIMAFFTVNDTTLERQKEAEIRNQLEENVKEAQRIANMKSDFLANMSHEIRTPMNAVIGMAEMALREELTDSARDYINQIKTSGNALLSIINDILDFSKIESGKMDIIPDDYDPLSVIYDISNILMTRIGEKDIELIGNVNPNLPVGLFGDETRIRQIIINLANNAVKFTKQGYVKINVDYSKISEDEINLEIAVVDTGIGIKKEDLKKLFVSFQQVDSKRNRNIEGTGLGLAICANLAKLMGGNVSVTSEYGKGSEFKVIIPQKVTDWTPCATVSEAQDKMFFWYWDGAADDQLFRDILSGLSVEAYPLEDIEVIEEKNLETFKNKKKYIYTSYRLYSENLQQYVDENQDFQFIVVCDKAIAAEDSKKNVLFIKRPFSSVGIAMALNGESFHSVNAEVLEFDFIAPDAKILIVDDNEVNLTVAEGLLEPLQMQVTTALSGKKALELLYEDDFDLVFMDHMMPELDGVETTRIIRRLHPELDDMPVIALSANAVGDAKSMFLSEGMNDFVAKPIELRTITAKLRQWLPSEKIKRIVEKASSDECSDQEELPTIGDLDVETGIGFVGNKKLYFTILEKYYLSIKTKADIIKACESAEDIKTYTIEVHALKSASKQIGAMELSSMAAELEACGNAGDVATIHEKTNALLDRYLGYYDVLKPMFEVVEDNTEKQEISKDKLIEFFDKMLVAADDLDMDAMEEVANAMNKFAYEGEAKDYMQQLKDAAENIDVDSIEAIINRWKEL